MQNRFQYLIMGAVATLLLGVGTISLLLSEAKADEPAPDNAAASAHVPLPETSSQSSVTEANIDRDIQPVEDAEIQRLVQERDALITAWEQTIIEQPGWLRTTVHYEQREDTAFTLPDGTFIPNEYIMDMWYLLDEIGSTVQMVNISYDLEKNLLQAATYQDGIWRNFAINSKNEGTAPYFWGDNVSTNRISNMTQHQLARAERSLVAFEIREAYTAFPTDDLDTPVSGRLIRQFFDADSGQPVLEEHFLLLVDGTEYFQGRFEYVLIERVDQLPAEVALWLEKEIQNE